MKSNLKSSLNYHRELLGRYPIHMKLLTMNKVFTDKQISNIFAVAIKRGFVA